MHVSWSAGPSCHFLPDRAGRAGHPGDVRTLLSSASARRRRSHRSSPSSWVRQRVTCSVDRAGVVDRRHDRSPPWPSGEASYGGDLPDHCDVPPAPAFPTPLPIEGPADAICRSRVASCVTESCPFSSSANIVECVRSGGAAGFRFIHSVPPSTMRSDNRRSMCGRKAGPSERTKSSSFMLIG